MALITCKECGAQISDSAAACPYCGAPVAPQPAAQPQYAAQPQPAAQPAAQPQYAAQQPAATICPDNHLVWSILVTILCCLPFGIVAIVKSSGVQNEFLANGFEAAKAKADDAKKWCIIGAICGVVFSVIYLILLACGIAAESALLDF